MKRKLVATVAVGTECSVPNVFVDGRSTHRTGRGLSVKSVFVSGRSSQVSSSPRPRKRVTFADDTPVSACVSECHRSTQRPRRMNLNVMDSVRPDNNKDNCVAQLEAGMQIPSFFFVFFRLAECRFLAL